MRRTEGADRAIQLFTYAYLSDRGQITCSLWRRVGAAVKAQLFGTGSSRWATVQVLDADPRRARRAINRLIQDTTRRNES